MQCFACGAEVMSGASYCYQCGARLPKQPEQDRQEQQSVNAEAQQAPPQAQPTAADSFRQSVAARQIDSAEPEKQLWIGGYSPRGMIGVWLSDGALTIALLLIWIIWVRQSWLWIAMALFVLLLWTYHLLLLVVRRLGVRYELTTQRLIHEHGIVRRVTDRIEVIDIDDVTFVQGIVERMFGVGTIRIVSSDRSTPELLMPGIAPVKQIADLIDDVRRRERHRRGLHIEAI